MNAVGSSETIPLEAGEIQPFTPSSLANLPAPPVFKLRAAGGREMRQYRKILHEEGIEFHSIDDIRAEIFNGLRKLYSPEQAAEAEARLSSVWEMGKQNIEVPPDEQAAIDDLLERLTKAWRPLRQLAADNMEFGEEALRIAVSMFLVGWSRFDLPYRREDGRTPLQLLDQVEDKLQKISAQAIEDKVEGILHQSLAWIELANACYDRLSLTKAEEKNSSSPPPSPLIQSGSTKTPSAKTAAASSKASASTGSPKRGSSKSRASASSRQAAAASAS